jgi:HK97 family phage major capsid protein
MPKVIATPTNSDELREMLHDGDVMNEVLSDPDSLHDFITGYAAESHERSPDVLAEIKAQGEKAAFEFLRSHGVENFDVRKLGLADPSQRPPARNTVYNKTAMGAKHDGVFNDMAEMLHGISSHSHKDESLNRKLGALKNEMSSLKPSDGGFLIPERLRAELLRVAHERAIVRSRARVIPMDSLTVPFPAIDETSHVSSIYGGVTGYWTEEGATLTESNPKFARVTLNAHKLTLYTEIPNELMTDSIISLQAFIGEIFPEALAWFEDIAFFVGGGVGEPLGFLNAPARIEITRGTALSITWQNIVDMFCRMLPSSLDRAVWVVAPDAVPELLTMVFTGSTVPILLGGGGFPSGSGTMPLSLLGRPVIISEKARAIGNAGDISFVDFGYYLLGDRQAMSARQSEDYRFKNDVTAFRVTERLDGRPWLLSAITPQNGSTNTLSAYVTLDTDLS